MKPIAPSDLSGCVDANTKIAENALTLEKETLGSEKKKLIPLDEAVNSRLTEK